MASLASFPKLRRLFVILLFTCFIARTLPTKANVDPSTQAYQEDIFLAPSMTHYEFSFNQLLNQLADIIQDNGVELLDLSLTSGRWLSHDDDHTLPSWLTTIPHPGMHLGIGITSSNSNSNTMRYKKVVRGLSGMLCASLDSAIQGTTVSPAVNWFPSLAPSSISISMHTSSSRIKYYIAKAPEESVCTENIGALLKLLPCSASYQGLASTIPPRDQLMASSSLVSIRIMVDASECDKVHLKLSLTVQWNRNMVNIVESSSSVVPSSPLEPLELLKTLLEQNATTDSNKTIDHCTASPSSTRLHYFSPTTTTTAAHQDDDAAITAVLSSHPQQCTQVKQGQLTTCTLLLHNTTTTTSNSHPPPPTAITSPFITTPPPPKVSSHLSFDSIVSGTLTLTIQPSIIYNDNDMIHVVQIVPWQTPPLLHTLQVSPSSSVVAWQRTLPPNQATKAAGLIELLLVPPPSNSTTTTTTTTTTTNIIHISVAIHKKMLGVFDYPTDPSRGIHFPPATVTYIPSSCADSSADSNTTTILYNTDDTDDNACSNSGLSQRHSLPIIVPIPIPDFSMYFNVICFTCMPVALLFGGVLNVLFSPPGKVVKVEGSEDASNSNSNSNSGPTVKERLRRLVAVGLLVGGLAVYLDKDLQRKADHWLNMGKESYYHLMSTGDKGGGGGVSTEL